MPTVSLDTILPYRQTLPISRVTGPTFSRCLKKSLREAHQMSALATPRTAQSSRLLIILLQNFKTTRRKRSALKLFLLVPGRLDYHVLKSFANFKCVKLTRATERLWLRISRKRGAVKAIRNSSLSPPDEPQPQTRFGYHPEAPRDTKSRAKKRIEANELDVVLMIRSQLIKRCPRTESTRN